MEKLIISGEHQHNLRLTLLSAPSPICDACILQPRHNNIRDVRSDYSAAAHTSHRPKREDNNNNNKTLIGLAVSVSKIKIEINRRAQFISETKIRSVIIP